MKKFLLPILLFLMFIPFCVSAETCDTDKITISSITMENKSDNVEELDEATANGKSINLNLSMSNVGDNIEYKIVVKNDSNDDYELDKTSFNLNSDYMNYSFETEDNTNIVKANSSKSVTLRIEYKNEVPEDKFKGGSYNDSKTMMVQLSNGNAINVPDTFKNPNTGVQSYILIILILLLISGSLYVLLKKKKYTKFMILVIGTAIIIPISVYALCKCELRINSTVKVEKIYIGNGIIYTDKMFGSFNTEWTHPQTGETFSFLSEIKLKPKWCSYHLDSINNDEDYCEFNDEQACYNNINNNYCYIKKDGSWNSCIDENYSLDGSTCQYNIQEDINSGYALPGEYTCEKNKSLGCRTGSKLEGDYTIFHNLIKQKAFYKYDTENYIIKNSYLCFTTDKEYCLSGDADNNQNNIQTLKKQQTWFNENGGTCEIDETNQTGRCTGAGYDYILVEDDNVEVWYQETTKTYTSTKGYCIYDGHSFCAL